MLTFKAGGRIVAVAVADLKADCTYAARVVLRRSSVGRTRLTVAGQFSGNGRLLGITAPRVPLKAGG